MFIRWQHSQWGEGEPPISVAGRAEQREARGPPTSLPAADYRGQRSCPLPFRKGMQTTSVFLNVINNSSESFLQPLCTLAF